MSIWMWNTTYLYRLLGKRTLKTSEDTSDSEWSRFTTGTWRSLCEIQKLRSTPGQDSIQQCRMQRYQRIAKDAKDLVMKNWRPDKVCEIQSWRILGQHVTFEELPNT